MSWFTILLVLIVAVVVYRHLSKRNSMGLTSSSYVSPTRYGVFGGDF